MPRFEVEISAEKEAALREFVAIAGGSISKPTASRTEANEVWRGQTGIAAMLIAASRAITDPDAKQRAVGGAVETLRHLVNPEEFTATGTPEAIYDNLLTYFAEAISSDLPENAYFTKTRDGIVLKLLYKFGYGVSPSDIIFTMETKGITDGQRKSRREVSEKHRLRLPHDFYDRANKPARKYFAERGLITSHKYDEWLASFQRRQSYIEEPNVHNDMDDEPDYDFKELNEALRLSLENLDSGFDIGPQNINR